MTGSTTDARYRSHTPFIKDLAPGIGRGVKLAYSMVRSPIA